MRCRTFAASSPWCCVVGAIPVSGRVHAGLGLRPPLHGRRCPQGLAGPQLGPLSQPANRGDGLDCEERGPARERAAGDVAGEREGVWRFRAGIRVPVGTAREQWVRGSVPARRRPGFRSDGIADGRPALQRRRKGFGTDRRHLPRNRAAEPVAKPSQSLRDPAARAEAACRLERRDDSRSESGRADSDRETARRQRGPHGEGSASPRPHRLSGTEPRRRSRRNPQGKDPRVELREPAHPGFLMLTPERTVAVAVQHKDGSRAFRGEVRLARSSKCKKPGCL